MVLYAGCVCSSLVASESTRKTELLSISLQANLHVYAHEIFTITCIQKLVLILSSLLSQQHKLVGSKVANLPASFAASRLLLTGLVCTSSHLILQKLLAQTLNGV